MYQYQVRLWNAGETALGAITNHTAAVAACTVRAFLRVLVGYKYYDSIAWVGYHKMRTGNDAGRGARLRKEQFLTQSMNQSCPFDGGNCKYGTWYEKIEVVAFFFRRDYVPPARIYDIKKKGECCLRPHAIYLYVPRRQGLSGCIITYWLVLI